MEGAELEALKGAKRILTDSKPFIAMEIHGEKLFAQVPRFLKSFGYDLVGSLKEYRVDSVYYFNMRR